MPSPVGHSLAAYAVYRGMGGSDSAPPRRRTLLGYCVAASLPDLDFLPGLLLGDSGRFHQGISHSLGAALLFGLGVAIVSRWVKGRIVWKTVFVLFSLYCSHLLLDYFSVDTGLPYGIPVWWPFSGEHHLSPIAVFPDIHRGSSPAEFFAGNFIQHNLWAIVQEILIFLPVIGLIIVTRQ